MCILLITNDLTGNKLKKSRKLNLHDPPRSTSGGLESGSVATGILVYIYIYIYINSNTFILDKNLS